MNRILFYILIIIALSACNYESEKLMKSENGKKPNNLINEKSPYLQQHAYNPVDWYPWGDEAFEKAASENKPIFLSIGYSTCHWCHVMERESFEDTTVANFLNKFFVSIKVDREERPDIDQIYMKVCQMMTGHGGWPLTIVMTPKKKPFFAGTYFPKESRGGRIGLLDLLAKIQDAWLNKQKEINGSADYIAAHLNSDESDVSLASPDNQIFDKAFDQFAERYDKEFGGIGSAPKFPSPHNLLFLLRHWKRTGKNEALEMVANTLRHMRAGGIFDQIGFGFHRYSTDRRWLVPHFEKMLYDQALLAIAYTETFQATDDAFYRKTAEEILTYVLRDMTSPEGGFYSAEDADSEGEEGRFYIWKADELREILDENFNEFAEVFGITEKGNYFDEATRVQTGENILHLTRTIDRVDSEKFESIRQKLFAIREKRIHPLKDRKILSDWNGLMIAALAKAGRVFDEGRYIAAAEKAAKFIQTELITDDRLLHRHMDGESGISGMLDDYAFNVWGLLELYNATFNPDYLLQAIDMNKSMEEKFADANSGGYYFSEAGRKDLITRAKEFYDGAIPSGNSVALQNLTRLSKYTADTDFDERADRLSKWFASKIGEHPTSAAFFLCGLDETLLHGKEIIITDGENGKESQKFLEVLNSTFLPGTVTLLLTEKSRESLIQLVDYLKNYPIEPGKTKFYICENFVCNQPVETAEEALKQLK